MSWPLRVPPNFFLPKVGVAINTVQGGWEEWVKRCGDHMTLHCKFKLKVSPGMTSP